MVNIDISNEEYYLSKVESYCYSLRDAMIDMSLKFPEISSFERYLSKLKEYNSIAYVMELLHKCWCFANPYYLFNSMPKDLSNEEMYNMILSKYKKGSVREGCGVLEEELDKEHNILLDAYYHAYQRAGQMTLAYNSYINNLYEIAEMICKNKGITLANGFIISTTIQTDKTPDQLRTVFYAVASEYNCCSANEDNCRIFLSIFDVTICTPEGSIVWFDTGSSKGNEPSIASIYTIFSSLGVEMNMNNKAIISKHFTYQNGEIKPEQLKARQTSKQERVREIVKEALK